MYFDVVADFYNQGKESEILIAEVQNTSNLNGRVIEELH